jgi:hypothetical protein
LFIVFIFTGAKKFAKVYPHISMFGMRCAMAALLLGLAAVPCAAFVVGGAATATALGAKSAVPVGRMSYLKMQNEELWLPSQDKVREIHLLQTDDCTHLDNI